MKKTLEKISQVFKSKKEMHSDRHLRNIEKGEKIVIDGKEFVKVKLKFVDTMDFNLAKHVDNLETENFLLKSELQNLQRQSDKSNQIIEQLQICTKNLIQENSQKKDQLQKIINQQDEEISILTKQIDEQNQKIETHKKIINGHVKKNKELSAENISNKKTEFILKDKLKLLEKKVSRLTNRNEKNQNKLEVLNKKEKRLEKSHKTSDKELLNNQNLNKVLTDKLFVQKNEIEYLKEELRRHKQQTANTQYSKWRGK